MSLYLGQAYGATGDFSRAAERRRRNVAATDQESSRPSTDVRIWTQAYLAQTLGRLGAFAEGRRHGEEALRLATLAGRGLAPIAAHSSLGSLYLAHQALDLARQFKERGNEALALHQLGVVQAYADPPEVAQAEAHYQQALTLAEELGMRPLQAHCHRDLGTLYARIGRRGQTSIELTTAIDLYRAISMTFWLPQVDAALAQTGGAEEPEGGVP